MVGLEPETFTHFIDAMLPEPEEFIHFDIAAVSELEAVARTMVNDAENLKRWHIFARIDQESVRTPEEFTDAFSTVFTERETFAK